MDLIHPAKHMMPFVYSLSDFAAFESGNIFLNKEGIFSHPLKLKSSCAFLNTHNAYEAETFSF